MTSESKFLNTFCCQLVLYPNLMYATRLEIGVDLEDLIHDHDNALAHSSVETNLELAHLFARLVIPRFCLVSGI